MRFREIFSILPFQCYYCCYHQFWLVDLIGWPISVVGSDWLVGWGSHRLLIGLLELDLFGSFLLCPVLLMTLGLFCTHPNSYDTIVLVGLMEFIFFFGIYIFWHKSMEYQNLIEQHLRADIIGVKSSATQKDIKLPRTLTHFANSLESHPWLVTSNQGFYIFLIRVRL